MYNVKFMKLFPYQYDVVETIGVTVILPGAPLFPWAPIDPWAPVAPKP